MRKERSHPNRTGFRASIEVWPGRGLWITLIPGVRSGRGVSLQMSQLPLDLVTGATGMLGSHIAEGLVARGRRVRALVRRGSDTRFLRGLGVEFVEGDLSDRDACARAVEGVDRVYHSAAKVGDWGPWREFQVGCIDATRNLATAAAG